jgi:hypothetical protein
MKQSITVDKMHLDCVLEYRDRTILILWKLSTKELDIKRFYLAWVENWRIPFKLGLCLAHLRRDMQREYSKRWTVLFTSHALGMS